MPRASIVTGFATRRERQRTGMKMLGLYDSGDVPKSAGTCDDRDDHGCRYGACSEPAPPMRTQSALVAMIILAMSPIGCSVPVEEDEGVEASSDPLVAEAARAKAASFED